MDISAALAADLAALSGLLDEPDASLEAALRALDTDLTAALGSYLAMTMTIVLDGHRVSFTISGSADGPPRDGTVAAAASLMIPLSSTADGETGATLTLYARTAGAFVDLTADLSYALGINLPDLVVDGHLHDSASGSGAAGMRGLDELAVVNQALGVLLGRGYTLDAARTELRRLSNQDGHSTDETQPGS